MTPPVYQARYGFAPLINDCLTLYHFFRHFWASILLAFFFHNWQSTKTIRARSSYLEQNKYLCASIFTDLRLYHRKEKYLLVYG
jgi:hypothetical protein